MSNSLATAVSSRYSDAYTVAGTVDGFGTTIKAIGIVIGGLLAVATLSTAGENGFVVVIGVAAGGAIATVLFLLGTLASAQGQILKATLDTAVNSSPFLSDEDRARIMSLPHGGSAAAAEWMCRCGQRNPASTGMCLECGAHRAA